MDPEVSSRRKIYLINGKLLNYVIKTWVGLMLGIVAMETFAHSDTLDDVDMLDVKFIVFAMIGVALFGTLPWFMNPKDTWRLAKSEPGNFQGICNRCAAFLPFVGLVVLIGAGIFWALVI